MAKEPPKPRPEVLRLGIVSSVIAALCCFTPIRVVVLSAFGLGWVAGYLDVVLLPALAVSFGLTAYLDNVRLDRCSTNALLCWVG